MSLEESCLVPVSAKPVRHGCLWQHSALTGDFQFLCPPEEVRHPIYFHDNCKTTCLGADDRKIKPDSGGVTKRSFSDTVPCCQTR